MTTCMETWIMTDSETLKRYYGRDFLESALPDLHDIEQRRRDDVWSRLKKATENCRNPYRRGADSFKRVGMLQTDALSDYCASFRRMKRILDKKL